MNVFLSYAVAPIDLPTGALLRAVAARYNISILLPDRTQIPHNGIAADTRDKIKKSDAVIALVTKAAPTSSINVVNLELQTAAQLGKPIIPLVESGVQIQPASETRNSGPPSLSPEPASSRGRQYFAFSIG